MTDQQLDSSTPAWFPTPEIIDRANVTAAARVLKLPDYPALHRWSVEHRAAFWEMAVARLGIRFKKPYAQMLDRVHPTRPRWLVGATMNLVDSAFNADPAAPAILFGHENTIDTISYAELRAMTARVANAVAKSGLTVGDAVAIVMPMTPWSVAIYLGLVAAGMAVVSIADSFAPAEIALRLRIASAKKVFVQDFVDWGGKSIGLYQKVLESEAPPAIVVSGAGVVRPHLRQGDQRFDDFLVDDDQLRTVAREPHDPINILFSSGTTGDPKAIPWDHTTPIKGAADGHFHHDLHPGDVVCWPTSLGWMMGPWLVWATLINRGTIALFSGAPTGRAFGEFVQNAGVNMLGVVPSLVRSWRASDCMAGLDWRRIRAFSSTGECSNADDQRFLMNLAGNKPVVEYCGGTEVGGGYLTSTVVQPNTPAAFTTPALGIDIAILDENGNPTNDGEAYLVGPSMGLSRSLLNRDHDSVYFTDTPAGADGNPLRKHGDGVKRLPHGGYAVSGRTDDTMNLGGVKVGCAELERAIVQLPQIRDVAAVAVPPADGGPSRLILFIVPNDVDSVDETQLKHATQQAIRQSLNPLFKVDQVRIVVSLPRTASNKVMRRELRKMVEG